MSNDNVPFCAVALPDLSNDTQAAFAHFERKAIADIEGNPTLRTPPAKRRGWLVRYESAPGSAVASSVAESMAGVSLGRIAELEVDNASLRKRADEFEARNEALNAYNDKLCNEEARLYARVAELEASDTVRNGLALHKRVTDAEHAVKEWQGQCANLRQEAKEHEENAAYWRKQCAVERKQAEAKAAELTPSARTIVENAKLRQHCAGLAAEVAELKARDVVTLDMLAELATDIAPEWPATEAQKLETVGIRIGMHALVYGLDLLAPAAAAKLLAGYLAALPARPAPMTAAGALDSLSAVTDALGAKAAK